ncbi:MAG: restriction endonuclease subunit S [Anaerolineae bacterium]
MERWPLPEGWEWRTLAEVCEINPRRPTIQRDDDAPTSFVPMAAVDEVEGRFAEVQIRPYREVKRGYTYFEENDVVFAKITPCMENGKAAIAQGLLDGFGFGTTEFHVLRPRPGMLPEWIHRYVRQLGFREEAKKHFRGAVGQQRVPQEFLESSPIPLPCPDDPARSLETQRRIVARLDALLAEVAAARRLHAEIVADTKQLMAAVSREVFSEVSATYASRSLKTLTSKIGSGSTPRGGRSAYPSSGIPFIRSLNVRWNAFSSTDLAFISPTTHQRMIATEVRPGDVLLNITGASIGRACCVPVEICPANVNQHVSIIRPTGDLRSRFLMYWLTSPATQDFIMRTQSGATRQALTKAQIEDFQIPLPPLQIQDRIVAYLDQFQDQLGEVETIYSAELDLLSQVEQAILAQAFRGEL